MLQEVTTFLRSFFETHPNRKIGFLIGVLIGASILLFGFFPVLFAFACGVIGLYIGSRFDSGDDLVYRTLRAIEKILPERFQRW